MPYIADNDWRTTKGNVARDLHWTGTDAAADNFAQLKEEVENNYSGAVVIGTSTSKYNCHGFVHASSHAWFNDIQPFLSDDYEQFTPGTLRLDDAVVYVKNGMITHSGFIIELSSNNITKVRSKWGEYPLVEHPPTSVPSAYGSIRYYLRKRDESLIGEHSVAKNEKNQKVDDLVSAMLLPDRLKELMLASTPDVAEEIVKSWPEFIELQLLGGINAEMYSADEREGSSKEALVILILAKHSRDSKLIMQAQSKLNSIRGLE